MPYEQTAQPADVGAKTRSAAASKRVSFAKTFVGEAFFIAMLLCD
jgi:hypothetical protein